ncbi:hypothetical protein [Treponema putidum]|uniref:hypothetical protein n=1 Tax=Treponema putidum TaxID=221027 RepID=UPI0021037F96|nr:hypothetical protein [Treponema putidum]UTY31725.1 hypothetical protein E4N75_09700 [Treponema putidum]
MSSFNEAEHPVISGGGKHKIVQSVVVEIGGVNVLVSTHEKDINNVLNKIKQADQVIYKDT